MTDTVIDTSTEEGKRLLADENEAARSNVNDNTGELAETSVEEQNRGRADNADDPPRREVINMSPADAARAAIAKKFRRPDAVPFNGDANDPEMLYGDVARTTEADPDPNLDPNDVEGAAAAASQTEQQPAAPTKRKLKIRGQDVELTDDEILAAAQKTLAGDSYLEEARTLLEEAKTIKAERAGRDRRHPDGQSSTQDDQELLDPPSDDQQHPADTKGVVEKILYGDPEEAARDLDQLIDKRTDEKADQRQLARLMNNDLAKSKAALKTFVDANPELANDKMAARAIESTLYDIYAEDIAKLGVVDADKMPKDPKVLADWHRFYRVHGHEVRDAASALEEAKTRVSKWRGTPQTAQQPPRKDPARVHVNVDRTARREAIPNQPTRTVSPRPDTSSMPQQRTKTSDVINQMRRARGQVTA